MDQITPTMPPSVTTVAQSASRPVGYAPTTDFLSHPSSETAEEARERYRRGWHDLYASTYNTAQDTMTPMPNPPAPPSAPQLRNNTYPHYYPHYSTQSPTHLTSQQLEQLLNAPPAIPSMIGHHSWTPLTDTYDSRLRPQSSLSQYPTTGVQDNFPEPTAHGPNGDNSSAYPDPSQFSFSDRMDPSGPQDNVPASTSQGPYYDVPSAYLEPSGFDDAFSDFCHWGSGMEDGMLAAATDFSLRRR